MALYFQQNFYLMNAQIGTALKTLYFFNVQVQYNNGFALWKYKHKSLFERG